MAMAMSPSRRDPRWEAIQPRTVPAKRTSAKSDTSSAIRCAPKITQTIATATASAGKLHRGMRSLPAPITTSKAMANALISKSARRRCRAQPRAGREGESDEDHDREQRSTHPRQSGRELGQTKCHAERAHDAEHH